MGRAGANNNNNNNLNRASGNSNSSRNSGGHYVNNTYSNARPEPRRDYERDRRDMGWPQRRRNNYNSSRHVGCGTRVFAGIIVLIIVAAVIFGKSSTSSLSTSISSSRAKLHTEILYQYDCVVDEINWIEDVSTLEDNLKDFYDETGVQPYIYLKAYDANLTTESDKEEFANEYYDNNIDNEYTFLFVYFAEKDVNNDVGYMCYVSGKQASSVMDTEAVDIFWGYVDEYWYSDLTTTNMFTKIFTKTASEIM